ncbi:MAG: sulfotransferase [Bacteroidetes bacterium]|nr:MAG: sulfotransferase [Bacteroidota bacterium]
MNKIQKIIKADKIDLFAKVVNKVFSPILSKKEKQLEKLLSPEPSVCPVIVIVGVPRSGTTLLYQLMTNVFQVGYFDNVSQLLYPYPLTGLHWSRKIYDNKPHNVFRSYYGRTYPYSMHAPSEMGIFWQQYFPKEKIILHPKEYQSEIKNVSKVFDKILRYEKRPFVLKNTYLSVRPAVVNQLPGVKVIHVKRNEEDNALALLAARKQFLGNENAWFSVKPPEYNSLIKLSPQEQTAGQVFYLNRFIEQYFPKRMEITYEEICSDLDGALKKIQAYTGLEKRPAENIILPKLIFKKRTAQAEQEEKITTFLEKLKRL